MNAVPLSLKRAIGVGIGLFILFIGFVDGGIVVGSAGDADHLPPSRRRPPTSCSWSACCSRSPCASCKISAALVISILVDDGDRARRRRHDAAAELRSLTPVFSTLGQFDLAEVFTKLGLLAAVLTIFAIMLTDFFDTMGTVTGVAAEAGLAKEDGSVPGRRPRSCSSTRVAAVVGGAAGVSSNTTYIESRGRRRRGRPDRLRVDRHRRPVPARVLLAPIAGIVPARATAPGPGPRRLPDVHPDQGHRRHRRRGGPPRAASRSS